MYREREKERKEEKQKESTRERDKEKKKRLSRNTSSDEAMYLGGKVDRVMLESECEGPSQHPMGRCKYGAPDVPDLRCRLMARGGKKKGNDRGD
jgi:hypothetical protein